MNEIYQPKLFKVSLYPSLWCTFGGRECWAKCKVPICVPILPRPLS